MTWLSIVQAILSQPELPGRLDQAAFSDLYQAVERAVGLAVEECSQTGCQSRTRQSPAMSGHVRQLGRSAHVPAGWAGLEADDPQNLAALRLQTRLVDALRQIFTLAKRIARAAVPLAWLHRGIEC